MGLHINEEAPNFTAETTEGNDQFSRMDRQRLGDFVFTSERFYAGVHHRAGLHGASQR